MSDNLNVGKMDEPPDLPTNHLVLLDNPTRSRVDRCLNATDAKSAMNYCSYCTYEELLKRVIEKIAEKATSEFTSLSALGFTSIPPSGYAASDDARQLTTLSQGALTFIYRPVSSNGVVPVFLTDCIFCKANF